MHTPVPVYRGQIDRSLCCVLDPDNKRYAPPQVPMHMSDEFEPVTQAPMTPALTPSAPTSSRTPDHYPPIDDFKLTDNARQVLYHQEHPPFRVVTAIVVEEGPGGWAKLYCKRGRDFMVIDAQKDQDRGDFGHWWELPGTRDVVG